MHRSISNLQCLLHSEVWIGCDGDDEIEDIDRTKNARLFWEFRLCVPTNIQLTMLAPLRVMIGGDGVSHSVFNGMNRSTTYAMNPFLKNESSS